MTQDFTADASKLAEAIAAVKPHSRMSEIGRQYCPRITPYRSYQIAHLHNRQMTTIVVQETGPNGYGCMATRDQVLIEAEETWRLVREISSDTLAVIDKAVTYLATKPGARMLLLASSGFLGATLEEQQHAIIDHAIHAGVVPRPPLGSFTEENGAFCFEPFGASGSEGLRTAVVERRLIGGSCPNIACLPTKNVIHSAKVADFVRHDRDFGSGTAPASIEMAEVRARKRRIVDGLGVSICPGLIVFTRIWWSFNSVVQVRANEHNRCRVPQSERNRALRDVPDILQLRDGGAVEADKKQPSLPAIGKRGRGAVPVRDEPPFGGRVDRGRAGQSGSGPRPGRSRGSRTGFWRR